MRLPPTPPKKKQTPLTFGSPSSFQISEIKKSPKARNRLISKAGDDNGNTQQDNQLITSRLQDALEVAKQREVTVKAELAKSDAIILELKSSVRQLKRQVEEVQKEKEYSEEKVQNLESSLHEYKEKIKQNGSLKEKLINKLQEKVVGSKSLSDNPTKDGAVGELQIQLDRAHAQIITSDMVRKELEDTLEAEKYTWNLRVQDQERQLSLMQQEYNKLEEDLDKCRSQWREAENGWTDEIKKMKSQLGGKNENVEGKLQVLEKEREELQRCLDEAMKELEAVDQELRQNPNVLEPLQNLYKWLIKRNGEDKVVIPNETDVIVQKIKDAVEATPDHSLKVTELENQLSVFRGDIKAKEESSAELRESLKEAVALLKPLQDAVAKTDREKEEMAKKLEATQKELEGEKTRTVSNLTPANSQRWKPTHPVSSPSRTMPSGEEQQERSARNKRDNAQLKLQRMFSDAHLRFEGIQKDNSSIVDENQFLRAKVEKLEKELQESMSTKKENDQKRNMASEMREAAIEQLEQDVKSYSQQLSRKEEDCRKLETELRNARNAARNIPNDYDDLKLQVDKMKDEVTRKDEIEKELTDVKKSLSDKTEDELLLRNSLQEALSLVKPLQTHLHTAVQKKRALKKELKRLKQQAIDRSFDYSRSVASDEMTTDYDGIINRLEEENSKLRLPSQLMQPNQSNLEARLVELKSRTEITEAKYESAAQENNKLNRVLKEKKDAENEMLEELSILQKRLQKSEQELKNAKYIATSALVKVEELTVAKMGNEKTMGINGEKGNVNNEENEKVIQSPDEQKRSMQPIKDNDKMLKTMAEQHGDSPSKLRNNRPTASPISATQKRGINWVGRKRFSVK